MTRYLIIFFPFVMLIVSPASGWMIEEPSVTLTFDQVASDSLGWKLSVPAEADDALRSVAIETDSQRIVIDQPIAAGQSITVLADGTVQTTGGLSLPPGSTPALTGLNDRNAQVHIRVASDAPRFDFRVLRPREEGWQWPDQSFEKLSWSMAKRADAPSEGGIVHNVSRNGLRSLYIHSPELDATTTMRSAFIPVTAEQMGVIDGNIGQLNIKCWVKAEGVEWAQSVKYGGPRVTLRFYDKDHKYLYQEVLVNQNNAGPLIRGNTDGWVPMRGQFKRVRRDAGIAYVQLWFGLHGKGKIYFDDVQLQPGRTLPLETRADFVFTEPLPEPVHPQPELSASARRRGFVGFHASPMSEILPNHRPQQQAVGMDTLTVRHEMAQGETASISFGIYRSSGNGEIRSEYKSTTLPESWLDFYTVRCWPQANTLGTRAKIVPELLDKLKSITLDADQSKQFWVTVRVPAGVAPGEYMGTMTLGDASGASYPVELRVHVRPFKLAENTDITQEMYYQYAHHYEFDDRTPDGVLKMELADMRDHGINAIHMQQYAYLAMDDIGQMTLDCSPLDPVLKTMREVGMPGRMSLSLYFAHFDKNVEKVMGVSWDSPEFVAAYKRFVTEMCEYVISKGANGLQLRVEDEPGNFPFLQKEVEHELHAMRGTPAQSVMNTGGVNDWVRKNLEFTDIARIYHLNNELLDLIQEHGNTFLYSGATIYEGQLSPIRYRAGLLAYKVAKAGGLGISWYTYRTVYRGIDPWGEAKGRSGHAEMTVYPDPETYEPIPTLQWEALRMGVNDLRYLLTLDHVVAQLETSGERPQLMHRMKAYRQKILDEISLDSADVERQAKQMTAEDYERVRAEISRLIQNGN